MSQGRFECVGEVLDPVTVGIAVDGEEVEAWILHYVGVCGQICARRPDYIGDLAVVYSLKRVLVHVGARFDFGENDGGGVEGHDVDFVVSLAPVPVGDGPAFGDKSVAGKILAPFAEIVMLHGIMN